MPHTELRQLFDQEMRDAMFSLGMYAFRPTPPLPDRADWEKYASLRQGVTYVAMLEDGLPLAAAGSTCMHENLRGTLYPTSAVWGVATHPAARRKGYVRQVMAALLGAERKSGKVFSTLYPFRESFYERLGYAALPQLKYANFSPAAAAPLLKKDLGGKVVLKPFSEVYEEYRGFLLKMQAQTHGMGVFDHGTPWNAERNPLWAAFAYAQDELQGVLLYKLEDGGEPHSLIMRAPRFYALNSHGRTLLLEWIARHVDQVTKAEISIPAYEQPGYWLTDLHVKTTQDFAPMGRVLDVARLSGMHTGPGSFSVQLIDPLCQWNDGCWKFATQGGSLQVSPAQPAEMDGTLSIQALAALIYGTLDPQDFALRNWGNPSQALQNTLRTMFPPMQAHLHEEF